MSRELFIYWHVAPDQLAAAGAAMAAFQQTLQQQHAGLVARLYRRSDAGGDRATVMETYALPGGVSDAVQTAIVAQSAQAAAAWCHGARHVEVFEPLPQ